MRNVSMDGWTEMQWAEICHAMLAASKLTEQFDPHQGGAYTRNNLKIHALYMRIYADMLEKVLGETI